MIIRYLNKWRMYGKIDTIHTPLCLVYAFR
nr:MAG TPA: hypothetical protein [Caudoviricetes sp.]